MRSTATWATGAIGSNATGESPTCRKGWVGTCIRPSVSWRISTSSAGYSVRRRLSAAAGSTNCSRAPASTPYPDRLAGKLSGGMKQKLAVCCALIHDPDLLILDEPTTGVDPLSRRQFWELIDRMRKRRPQMSVIVASADMDEAEGFHWLAAMNAGRLIATGSPGDIRAGAGMATLAEAFIALLPEAMRRSHHQVVIPPRIQRPGPPAIEAVGLTKRFGNSVVVDDVSFRIEQGEIFGFLGSNGCGKSTTMKMLTGLLPATSGEATLFGRPVDPRDIETRSISATCHSPSRSTGN